MPATLSPAARDVWKPGTPIQCGGADELPAEDCLAAAGRVNVRDVGGTDALLAARLAAGDDHALEDVQRCLSGDPAVAAADHVTSTQAAAARQAGHPAARTRAEWRHAVHRTLGLVQAHRDPNTEVAVHGLRLPLNALLVVRAFEIWVHDNDIRRVAGLSPAVPDAPTLHLMTDLAARLLPRAAAHTGLPGPVSVHLVLTGPGGGTWDVTLGASPGIAQPGPAPVRIVTDAVGFCQLVASRASPADLDLAITGDPGRATGVLAAAATLALD